jgi:small redox-active disulfide protein 2
MKDVKVLGPGCPKCQELMKQTQQAVTELGLECHLEKVTDIQEIMRFGVMFTPALVVDGAVKVSGKVPSVEDIKLMLA